MAFFCFFFFSIVERQTAESDEKEELHFFTLSVNISFVDPLSMRSHVNVFVRIIDAINGRRERARVSIIFGCNGDSSNSIDVEQHNICAFRGRTQNIHRRRHRRHRRRRRFHRSRSVNVCEAVCFSFFTFRVSFFLNSTITTTLMVSRLVFSRNANNERCVCFVCCSYTHKHTLTPAFVAILCAGAHIQLHCATITHSNADKKERTNETKCKHRDNIWASVGCAQTKSKRKEEEFNKKEAENFQLFQVVRTGQFL